MLTDPPLIQISRLSKHYREGAVNRTVFAGFDCTIYPGEIVALLGRSGSGKSTLLNLISGIDLPDQGDIVFDGTLVTTIGETERTYIRRRKIGFVFQFFNLIPTLTLAENLWLPLELNRVATAERREQALSWLDQVGLGDRQYSYPEQLSGGEQQRLAILRALIHQPKLLLADEPTGNLDTETGEKVLTLLLDLARQSASTVLMVTHSLEVAHQADRVLQLNDGRVQELTL